MGCRAMIRNRNAGSTTRSNRDTVGQTDRPLQLLRRRRRRRSIVPHSAPATIANDAGSGTAVTPASVALALAPDDDPTNDARSLPFTPAPAPAPAPNADPLVAIGGPWYWIVLSIVP